jgi:hypothetical protein
MSGLTQVQLARLAGVHVNGIKRLERMDGISPSLFDDLVRDGRMPTPKRINSRTVWDRRLLDDFFDALPALGERNPWDIDLRDDRQRE